MARPGDLLALAVDVADMTTSAEHTPLDPDDAAQTLDGLIHRARALLDYPGDYRPPALAEELEDD